MPDQSKSFPLTTNVKIENKKKLSRLNILSVDNCHPQEEATTKQAKPKQWDEQQAKSETTQD